MKRFLLLVIILCITTGCANSSNTVSSADTFSNALYAIYPTDMIETNPSETNDYISYNKEISLHFPQIYYSDSSDTIKAKQAQINTHLFELATGYNTQLITSRETYDLKSYTSQYEISFTDEDLLSIKFENQLLSISHANQYCYGITLNTTTGEYLAISDYIAITSDLIEQIKSHNITYSSQPNYDEDFVISATDAFIENYNNGFVDETDCFYLDSDTLHIITPVLQGNGNYIILDCPLSSAQLLQ